jgi:hypothetical protein
MSESSAISGVLGRISEEITGSFIDGCSHLFPDAPTRHQTGALLFANHLMNLWSAGKHARYWMLADQFLTTKTVTLIGFYDSLRSHTDRCALGALDGPKGYARVKASLQSRWGKLFRDPKFVLESLSAIPPLHVLRERNSKWLFQNSRTSLSEEEWHKRLSWSYFAEIYLRDLLWYSARARRSGRVSEADTVDQSILSLVDQNSLEPLRSYRHRSDSLLLCGTHSGLHYLIAQPILAEALGQKPIAIMAGRSRPEEIAVADPVAALYGIVKKLRDAKQYVAVAGDGGGGSPNYPMNICGRPVFFATGTPHAILHAKCKNAFYIFKWENGRLHLDLDTSTQLEAGESLQDWTQRWMSSYHKYIIDIVTGNPENLRCRNGMWNRVLADMEY